MITDQKGIHVIKCQKIELGGDGEPRYVPQDVEIELYTEVNLVEEERVERDVWRARKKGEIGFSVGRDPSAAILQAVGLGGLLGKEDAELPAWLAGAAEEAEELTYGVDRQTAEGT